MTGSAKLAYIMLGMPAATRADEHLAGKCRYRRGFTFGFPPWGQRLPTGCRPWSWGRSGHEWHEFGGHGDEGAHHVAVFVFEDVAVVHVAAAVGGEADGDFGDLVRVDADGVLEVRRSSRCP